MVSYDFTVIYKFGSTNINADALYIFNVSCDDLKQMRIFQFGTKVMTVTSSMTNKNRVGLNANNFTDFNKMQILIYMSVLHLVKHPY